MLCDCVRISVRDKSFTEALLKEDFLEDLLTIAESPIGSSDECHKTSVSQMALRCLINMMNGNNSASDLFLGVTVRGLERILAMLQIMSQNTEYSPSMHLVTKLLYMLLSQRFAHCNYDDMSGQTKIFYIHFNFISSITSASTL